MVCYISATFSSSVAKLDLRSSGAGLGSSLVTEDENIALKILSADLKVDKDTTCLDYIMIVCNS